MSTLVPTVPDRTIDAIMEVLVLRGFDVYQRLRNRDGAAVLRARGDVDWTNRLAATETTRIAVSFPIVVIALVRKAGTGDLEFRITKRGATSGPVKVTAGGASPPATHPRYTPRRCTSTNCPERGSSVLGKLKLGFGL